MTENIFEMLMRPRGRQKYAPSGYPGTPPTQTAFMQYGAGGGGRGGGGTGISIEPPILSGNTTENRINWASRLGRFDEGYTPHEMSWLWNMMGGPMGFHNNPWGSGPLGSGWSGWGHTATQPITGDVNVLGGSRHMGQRKNK